MKTRLLQCLFLGGVYQIISIILNFIPATTLLNGLFYTAVSVKKFNHTNYTLLH